MLDVVLFKITGIKAISASADIGVARLGSNPPSQAGELKVPWHDLQPDPDLFSLLSWQGRTSDFAGRKAEMEELLRWCGDGPAVSIKFITGEGGVGKSRLAAEFATAMREAGWGSGFVRLDKPATLKTAGKSCCSPTPRMKKRDGS